MARGKFLVIAVVILLLAINHFNRPILSSSYLGKEHSNEVLLIVTGDIMVHNTQLASAYRASSNDYDFAEWFEEIEPYLHESDLVLGNLETTLSGEDMEYTGFPAFNSPEALADNLKKAGFDIVSTANNHSLDRGELGVRRTLEHLEKAGLYFTGTARSQEERDSFLSVTKNGIKITFLAYTYGTNGIQIPKGKEYIVNMIDEELIRSDIQKARVNSDLVVVSLHWGYEYNREPHPNQQKLSENIILWGADIIAGNHPHVLQPVEFITTESGRKGVIINSLGNLIADQIVAHTDNSMMVRLHYVRSRNGIRLVEVTGVPTWIHRHYKEGRLAFRVLPIADAMYSYRKGKDPYLTEANYENMKRVWEDTTSHVWLTPYSKKIKHLQTATSLINWLLCLY